MNRDTNISVDGILLTIYQVHQDVRDMFLVLRGWTLYHSGVAHAAAGWCGFDYSPP